MVVERARSDVSGESRSCFTDSFLAPRASNESGSHPGLGALKADVGHASPGKSMLAGFAVPFSVPSWPGAGRNGATHLTEARLAGTGRSSSEHSALEQVTSFS